MSYSTVGGTLADDAVLPDNQIEEIEADRSWPAILLRIVARIVPAEILAPDAKMLRLILLAKGIRMFSWGFLAVMLVTYLITLGLSEYKIGLLFSLTLLGDSAISLLITSHADKVGRRKMLLAGGALSVLTSFVFAFTPYYPLLVAAATLGVISPSGNEVGPFMAIELSAIAQITHEDARTALMAWYNLVSCFSSACGALFCGALLSALTGGSEGGNLGALGGASDTSSAAAAVSVAHRPYQAVMVLYALLQVAKTYTFSRLDATVEVPPSTAAEVKKSPVGACACPSVRVCVCVCLSVPVRLQCHQLNPIPPTHTHTHTYTYTYT